MNFTVIVILHPPDTVQRQQVHVISSPGVIEPEESELGFGVDNVQLTMPERAILSKVPFRGVSLVTKEC